MITAISLPFLAVFIAVAEDPAKHLSDSDRTARNAAIELAAKKQNREFRERCILEFPAKSSRLPSEYDVVVYFGPYSFGVIKIQVRGDAATAEMATPDALRQGTLKHSQVDRVSRQFLYLFRSESRYRDPEDYYPGGFSYSSHAPDCTIEFRSAVGDSVIFKSKTMQWDARSIDVREGPQPFALAWFVESLYGLCQKLGDQTSMREGRAKVLSRLSKMRPAEIDLEEYPHSLEAIEAETYLRLLTNLKEKPAIDHLRRFGRISEARKLEIDLAADPTEMFRTILADEYDDLWDWVLDQSLSCMNKDARRVMLLKSLRECTTRSALQTLISELRRYRNDEATIGAVKKVYDQRAEDRETRIKAASLLLSATHGERYFRDLRHEAVSTRMDFEQFYDPSKRALDALLSYSLTECEADDAHRRQVNKIARSMLQRIPRHPTGIYHPLKSLVWYLGQIGQEQDAPLLRALCEDSAVRVASAYSLARIDSVQAALLARQHVAALTAARRGKPPGDHPNVYWNTVADYARLFVALGDVSAFKLYKQYLEQLVANSEPGYELEYYQDLARSVLQVLRADNRDQELTRAAVFVRKYWFSLSSVIDDEYFRHVLANRLIARGLDEKRTREVLSNAAHRR